MTGRWSPWYNQPDPPRPYGDTTTYRIAEQWLAGLPVEDWGCGYGWYKTIHDGDYLGIDGTPGYADIVTDLVTYRSETPGLLLRHVLDHNVDWYDILTNAADSCTHTLVVILFVPPTRDDTTTLIGWNRQLGVPDLALPHDTIADYCPEWVDYRTDTQHGTERVYVRRR
jgi:hypothetical protein